jgi:Protein of unknown function (DUF3089)
MLKIMLRASFWAFLIIFSACASHKPRLAFDPVAIPPAPDYADLTNWAARPERADLADRTPRPDIADRQSTAPVDVFFLHPTTLIGTRRDHRRWNGDVRDVDLNRATDESSMLYQASLFNGAGRVFAPRYRQAHLTSFFGDDKASAEKALAVAYTDVVAAFEHYLQHDNQGRPFILAGHSQGALHIRTLLQQRIEGKPIQQQLVAAYVVGYPVKKGFFKTLPACETPDQTGCYCTWRTWERKYGCKKATERDVVCTNPLYWNTTEAVYAPTTLSRGGVVRPFTRVYPQFADAEVHEGILLCTKPKFKGSILFTRKNYHIGDFNIYYMDVRENAQTRAAAFLKR